MRAIILAAGRGSRMRHLTDDMPKGLVAYKGKALIQHQCEALRAAGATEIGIVTGYRAPQLAPYADAVFHNPDWATTQMVTSLATAAAWLEAGPVIVSYSDIFYTSQTVVALSRALSDLAISFDPEWRSLWEGRFDDPLDDAETFRFKEGTKHLLQIGGKPGTIEEIQGQYMGLLRFTPASWQAAQSIRAGLAKDVCAKLHMTGLLQRLLDADHTIEAIACHGSWGEIDSVEDLNYYQSV
jgi:choline kinase